MYALAWRPCGGGLLTGCEDGVVREWDRTTGVLETLYSHGDFEVVTLACSPCGRWVAAGCWDSCIVVLSRDLPPFRFATHQRQLPLGSLVFSRDGRWLVTTCGTDIAIYDWSSSNPCAGSSELRPVALARRQIHAERTTTPTSPGPLRTERSVASTAIAAVEISPNSEHMIAASFDGHLISWQLSGLPEQLREHASGARPSMSPTTPTGDSRKWTRRQQQQQQQQNQQQQQQQLEEERERAQRDGGCMLLLGKELSAAHSREIWDVTFCADGKRFVGAALNGNLLLGALDRPNVDASVQIGASELWTIHAHPFCPLIAVGDSRGRVHIREDLPVRAPLAAHT